MEELLAKLIEAVNKNTAVVETLLYQLSSINHNEERLCNIAVAQKTVSMEIAEEVRTLSNRLLLR